VHVFARGKRLVDDGRMVAEERFVPTTNRRFDVEGTKGQEQ